MSVAVFRHYARTYGTHRERMLECLTELGAKVTLPVRHKDFVANHAAIEETVEAELARVSPEVLVWTLFGATAMRFALKHAFRHPDAREYRRAAAAFMDKKQLPRTLLTKLARACRSEKNATLSLHMLHSAVLAMLNEIIATMHREPKTAFVAMPFSIPAMREHYERLYTPALTILEYRPLRAWGGFGTEDYQDLLYTLIDRCGAMLADITTLNANVMHEVGYALGRRTKFIILVAEEGQPVPANLGDLTVLRYRAKGRNWQPRAVGEIAAAVALYEYTAITQLPGAASRRLVGPLKVTR